MGSVPIISCKCWFSPWLGNFAHPLSFVPLPRTLIPMLPLCCFLFYHTPRHANTKNDRCRGVTSVFLNSDREHICCWDSKNHVTFNIFKILYLSLFETSFLPTFVLWLVCFEFHRLFFSAYPLVFHYADPPYFRLLLVSLAKWVFCSASGVSSFQLVYCIKLKSAPHLNTVVTCMIGLRLLRFLSLVGFSVMSCGWSTTLP